METVDENAANFSSQLKSNEDSIINSWFLMGSHLNCFLVLAIYFVFILKIGPYFMKNRPPFQLTNIILVYNFIQVIFSGYTLLKGLRVMNETGLMPDQCLNDSEDIKYKLYDAAHVYMVAKFSELLETNFFVLRKKDNQVTFLHVYHHSAIFFYSWILLKYELNLVISALVLGTLNSFVHIIMYTYYTLSIFPSVTKYLWWKKYLTTLQMIQFFLIIMYVIFEYTTSKCHFSFLLVFSFLFNISLMIVLFGRFYIKTYGSKDKIKDKVCKQE